MRARFKAPLHRVDNAARLRGTEGQKRHSGDSQESGNHASLCALAAK